MDSSSVGFGRERTMHDIVYENSFIWLNQLIVSAVDMGSNIDRKYKESIYRAMDIKRNCTSTNTSTKRTVFTFTMPEEVDGK